jgi:hypothetical protein
MRAALLTLALLFVPLAHAADRGAEAEKEMIKAKQAMERREFEVAIGHLLVARSLAPEASGPYLNLGLAYAALDRCADAIPMFEEYLRRKKKDPHPSAATMLAACREKLTPEPPPAPPPAETRAPAPPPPAPSEPDEDEPIPPPVRAPAPPPAHLSLKISPVAAHVILNGEVIPKETRELERDLLAGGYQLKVEQKGWVPFARDFWVQPGSTVIETVVLRKKRIWPTVVGVLAAVAVTGAVVAIIVTQVPSSSGPSGETRFSTETTR